jgi:hemoglobin-like flavoprotein
MNRLDEKKELVTSIKEHERKKQIIEETHNLIKEWNNLTLPQQTEKRDSIIRSIPLLAEQDRALCIKHLSEAGIVNYRKTLERVKKYAKEMGIDKEEAISINYAPILFPLTPAQDFIDSKAYVAIPIKHLINNRLEPVNYIITSEREKICLSEEELLRMNFYYDRTPYLLGKWSEKSIDSFLKGEDKITIAETFDDIYQLCRTYIDFGNDSWSKYIAIWIIGTYYHRIFQTYPYVHLNGDMESGKTKTLMLTALLSFNGELTFNSSPSYIVRAVHNNHSTCCVDEVERLKRSDDQDSQLLIAMYNSGYKKGSFCGKSEQAEKNGQWLPKRFEAYSPKMLASIRALEPSLSSRCIPITMLKTSNKDIRNRELNTNHPAFQKIRDKLYSIMLTYFPFIKTFYEQIEDQEILGREWELWKPILAIARAIDGNDGSLYSEIRNLAIETQNLKKQAHIEETITPKVLITLRDSLINEPLPQDNFYSTLQLLNILKDSEEEEFAWLKDEKKQNKGRWLGDVLRRSGIVTGRAEQKKIEAKNVKGYTIHLNKIQERVQNYEL